jgi:hypothetical protein
MYNKYIVGILILIIAVLGYFLIFRVDTVKKNDIGNKPTEVAYDTKDQSLVNNEIRGYWTSPEDDNEKFEWNGEKLVDWMGNEIKSVSDYKIYATVDVPGEVIQNLENFSSYIEIKKDNISKWYKIMRFTNLELDLENPDTHEKIILKR